MLDIPELLGERASETGLDKNKPSRKDSRGLCDSVVDRDEVVFLFIHFSPTIPICNIGEVFS
jgi:hypothetical protein